MPSDIKNSPTTRRASGVAIHQGSSSPTDPESDQFGRATPAKGIAPRAATRTDVPLPLGISRMANSKPKAYSSSSSSADVPFIHTDFQENPMPGDINVITAKKAYTTDTCVSHGDTSELEALRKELEVANIKIAAMDRELAQQRIPPSAAANYHTKNAGMPYIPRSADQFQTPWNNNNKPGCQPYISSVEMSPSVTSSTTWTPATSANASTYEYRPTLSTAPQPQRPANIRVDTWAANQQFTSGLGEQAYDMNRRTHGTLNRPGSAMSGTYYHGANPFLGNVPPSPIGFSPPLTPMQIQQMSLMPNLSNAYTGRMAANGLSPTALEFDAGAQDNVSTYVPPGEPTNYRRLLDRNMNCNWKYIVDKIVCNNDQQASIFLQQKLKLSGPDEKYELVEAIIAQAYLLMVNRFGNFLIQRCFEHGTQDQVIALANAIRGNTLNLSMDAFGCHVVQKAFDAVPEEYKAMMVHELLTRIPETVIHRYACHVWQKLFELRWSDSPPQIMKYVNEALRGMWHEVALGETGSLVVQNIFENCLEEDKRPCVNEVLASIDVIAHGQFGNWCIQHICEHGLPADRSRAVEHVLRYANEYSIDQFASKVVEKCLKIEHPNFTDRYLERVCEGRADRPRMPLIDIAGDQYGNYLIQYILINGNAQHKEVVSSHVRKHMVSLRGSKFGSRVAMLCSNPAVTTRPGAPAGMQPNNRYMHGVGSGRSTMNASFR